MPKPLEGDKVALSPGEFTEISATLLTDKIEQLGATPVATSDPTATIILTNPALALSASSSESAALTSSRPLRVPYHYLAHSTSQKADPSTLTPPLPFLLNPWHEDQLNQPLRIWVSVNIKRPLRDDPHEAKAAVEAQLAQAGALIVAKRHQADVLVVDRRTDFYQRVIKAELAEGDPRRVAEREWVEACLGAGKLLAVTEGDLLAVKAEPPASGIVAGGVKVEVEGESERESSADSFAAEEAAGKRGPGRPTGKPRIEYTPRDDDFLVRYLAFFHPDGSWGSRKTYEMMVSRSGDYQIADRHSAQSWHERFKKNAGPLGRRVQRLVTEGLDMRLRTAAEREKHKGSPKAGAEAGATTAAVATATEATATTTATTAAAVTATTTTVAATTTSVQTSAEQDANSTNQTSIVQSTTAAKAVAVEDIRVKAEEARTAPAEAPLPSPVAEAAAQVVEGGPAPPTAQPEPAAEPPTTGKRKLVDIQDNESVAPVKKGAAQVQPPIFQRLGRSVKPPEANAGAAAVPATESASGAPTGEGSSAEEPAAKRARTEAAGESTPAAVPHAAVETLASGAAAQAVPASVAHDGPASGVTNGSEASAPPAQSAAPPAQVVSPSTQLEPAPAAPIQSTSSTKDAEKPPQTLVKDTVQVNTTEVIIEATQVRPERTPSPPIAADQAYPTVASIQAAEAAVAAAEASTPGKIQKISVARAGTPTQRKRARASEAVASSSALPKLPRASLAAHLVAPRSQTRKRLETIAASATVPPPRAARASVSASPAPPPRRPAPISAAERAQRVAEGQAKVLAQRDTYRARIQAYRDRYGIGGSEFMEIVKGLEHRGQGEAYWEDIETALRERFGF